MNIPTRKLHSFPLSENAQKARILLKALDLKYEAVEIDIPAGAHKEPAYLAVSPQGQVPVLVDGDARITESHAILVYLAYRYGGERWRPSSAIEAAEITQWMSLSANELQRTLHLARVHFLLGVPADIEAAQSGGRDALHRLNVHLATRAWLVGDAPSLADIACAPMAALASDAKVDTAEFTHVNAWLLRFSSLSMFAPLG